MAKHRLTTTDILERGVIELGAGDWLRIDQDRIQRFADATGDQQWIHVDPERAAEGPFGATIAHGYLVLSLVPHLFEQLLEITDLAMGVNYGTERLRFTCPVPVDSDVRLRATIRGAEARGDAVRYLLEVAVEIRDQDRPAIVGEVVYLASPDP